MPVQIDGAAGAIEAEHKLIGGAKAPGVENTIFELPVGRPKNPRGRVT